MRDSQHYVELARRGRHRAAATGPKAVASVAPQLFWQGPAPLDVDAPTTGDAVYAVANHGRWVAECPDCKGAQLTSPEDRRFLCDACGNATNGGKYRPVVWPRSHAQIGQLLDARTDQRLRNWSPGESVADLKRENKELGIS